MPATGRPFTGTSSRAAGPVALVLDFTRYDTAEAMDDLRAAFAALVTDAELPPSAAAVRHVRTARAINTALAAFGALFVLSKTAVPPSLTVVDGCVPTYVMALFAPSRKSEEKKGGSGGATPIAETAWLYAATDTENVIVDEDNDEEEGGARASSSSPKTGGLGLRRAQRLWTSNRHYDDEVLPIVIGGLKSRLFSSSPPKNAASNANEDDAQQVVVGKTDGGRRLRAVYGALLKALCAINVQTSAVDSSTAVEASVASGSKRPRAEGASSSSTLLPNVTRPNILLATFGRECGDSNAAKGEVAKEEKEAREGAAAKQPSSGGEGAAGDAMAAIAASAVAMRLLATGTQLYVGHHHERCCNSNGSTAQDANLAPLFALAAASGGAGGALEAEDDEEGEEGAPRACQNGCGVGGGGAMPTVLDHILGAADDAMRASGHRLDTSAAAACGTAPSAAAARVARYPIHLSPAVAAGPSAPAAMAGPCGVSHVGSETLRLQSV